MKNVLDNEDPLTITLERAIEIINAKIQACLDLEQVSSHYLL